MQSMTIEAVLAARRKQCVGMANNMLSELKKLKAKDDVLFKMEEHRDVIHTSNFEWFNDDRAFKFVLNLTVSNFISLDVYMQGEMRILIADRFETSSGSHQWRNYCV